MFTGIITDTGKIKELVGGKSTRMVITTSYREETINIGASICCSGACLTVVDKKNGNFTVDISEETLAKTNLGSWQIGREINLERALKIGDELGGHIVTGHVDGLAQVFAIDQLDNSYKFIFSVPQELKKFIAAKGSVTLDGVSLTVNEVNDNKFTVNIIPHTWQNTTFKHLKKDDKVNLEIDILARYVARLTL